MPKYKMAMTAYGLSRGDVFESDDPGWAERVKGGVVSVVDGGDSSKPDLHTVPDDADVIDRDTLKTRQANSDTEPVHEGEFYREPVLVDVNDDGGGDGE